MKAHLLKYSTIEARQAKRHSAMQARKLASPFDWAELASIRSACRIATMSPPKQMDPNDVVMVRRKLLLMADPQHPDSDGSYHHVPTVPATITWMEYCTNANATRKTRCRSCCKTCARR
jgi:hypothetical protein